MRMGPRTTGRVAKGTEARWFLLGLREAPHVLCGPQEDSAGAAPEPLETGYSRPQPAQLMDRVQWSEGPSVDAGKAALRGGHWSRASSG